jgi:hypothetical protein
MVVPSVWGFLHFQNQQSLLPHLQQALVEFQCVPTIPVLLRALHQNLFMSPYCHEMRGEVETYAVPHHLHYPHLDHLISCVLRVPAWRGSRG